MQSRAPDPSDPREVRVHTMLANGLLVAEVARAEKMTRQSMWEYCARRGWLPDEDKSGFSETIAEKDRRARSRKRKRSASA